MELYLMWGLTAPLFAYGVRHGVLAIQDLGRELRFTRRRPTPIRDAMAGVVLLHGRARRAEGSLEAPLSGRPCLAYALHPHLGQVGLTQSVPFVLEDESGSARIESYRVRLLAPDLVASHHERILAAGDEVYVLGQAVREPDPAGQGGSYREPPMRLVLRENRRYGVLVAYQDRPSLRRYAAWNLAKGSLALALAAATIVI